MNSREKVKQETGIKAFKREGLLPDVIRSAVDGALLVNIWAIQFIFSALASAMKATKTYIGCFEVVKNACFVTPFIASSLLSRVKTHRPWYLVAEFIMTLSFIIMGMTGMFSQMLSRGTFFTLLLLAIFVWRISCVQCWNIFAVWMGKRVPLHHLGKFFSWRGILSYWIAPVIYSTLLFSTLLNDFSWEDRNGETAYDMHGLGLVALMWASFYIVQYLMVSRIENRPTALGEGRGGLRCP